MDLDRPLERPIAASLTARQLADELEARGVRAPGYKAVEALQALLDDEWLREEGERQARVAARDAAARLQREAALAQARREAEAAEEERALAGDAHLRHLVALAAADGLPPHLLLRGAAPCGVRALLRQLAARGAALGAPHSLDLCRCGLGDDVGAVLGAVLGAVGCLHRLELDGNAFGPRTALALRDGVLGNPACALRSLSLEGCPVAGDDGRDMRGLEALADVVALQGAAQPDHDVGALRGDGDGDGAAGEEATPDNGAAPPGNSSGGAAGSSGGANAAPAEEAAGLLHLSLFDCRVGQAGGAILASAAAASRRLLVLQLSPFDGVDDADLAAIAQALARNRALAAEAAAAAAAARAQADAAAEEAAQAARHMAALHAEATWLVDQRGARTAAHEAAARAATDAAREEGIQRELAEATRRERARAEVAAAARAAEAAPKGAKKKK